MFVDSWVQSLAESWSSKGNNSAPVISHILSKQPGLVTGMGKIVRKKRCHFLF